MYTRALRADIQRQEKQIWAQQQQHKQQQQQQQQQQHQQQQQQQQQLSPARSVQPYVLGHDAVGTYIIATADYTLAVIHQ
jgi:hypothetical protein